MSGVPSWAVRGARIVCVIDASLATGRPRVRGANYPQDGGIYTVRKVVFDSSDGAALLLLRECNNRNPSRWALEPGFDARHFKPLVTRTQEQDLSQFTHHLTGVPVDA